MPPWVVPGTGMVMNAYVALIRAVNVGGTGKLPMSDLKELCGTGGIPDGPDLPGQRQRRLRGELILSADRVKAALESALEAYAGKPVGVLVRHGRRDGGGRRRQSVPRRLAERDGGDLPRRAAALRRRGAGDRPGQRGDPPREVREIYVRYERTRDGPVSAEDPRRRGRHGTGPTSTRSPGSRRWPPNWADRSGRAGADRRRSRIPARAIHRWRVRRRPLTVNAPLQQPTPSGPWSARPGRVRAGWLDRRGPG